jgi:hypothetical protein
LITNNKIPFVRIVSCNPLEIRHEENLVPPPYSGLPSNDQSQWKDFKNEYKNIFINIWNEFNNWIKEQGASLHFGKAMIILPLFWDQYDNAQRLHEFGYGIHLDTYTFTDQQMLQSIE